MFQEKFPGIGQLFHRVDVTAAEGTTEALRPVVTEAADPYPAAKVRDKEEIKDENNRQLALSLSIFLALLGLALVIGALGVAITFALSVFERTREIGLLRAVGGPGPLGGSITGESIVITLLGTVLGLIIGLGGGVATMLAQRDTLETVRIKGVARLRPGGAGDGGRDRDPGLGHPRLPGHPPRRPPGRHGRMSGAPDGPRTPTAPAVSPVPRRAPPGHPHHAPPRRVAPRRRRRLHVGCRGRPGPGDLLRPEQEGPQPRPCGRGAGPRSARSTADAGSPSRARRWSPTTPTGWPRPSAATPSGTASPASATTGWPSRSRRPGPRPGLTLKPTAVPPPGVARCAAVPGIAADADCGLAPAPPRAPSDYGKMARARRLPGVLRPRPPWPTWAIVRAALVHVDEVRLVLSEVALGKEDSDTAARGRDRRDVLLAAECPG